MRNYKPTNLCYILSHLSTGNTNKVWREVALLISIYFPPEPGGGSSVAWNRASILHKIGYTVFVICGFPAYPSGKVLDPLYKGKIFCIEPMENFTVIRIRLLPLEYAGYLRRLVIFLNFIFLSLIYIPKILRITGKITLVYTIAPIIFSSFTGFIYSKLTKSLFVHEVSDLWPEELVVFKTRLWFFLAPIGKIVAKLAYFFPDIIIAIGQLAADYISREYKPRGVVYVMPIGVDPSKFPRIAKDESRNQLVVNRVIPEVLVNKFVILYSGLISNATRVENLAYAAEKLKDENEIAFLIVGEGENRRNLERLKHEYNLTNFYLLPFQPRDVMPGIISAADICIISLPPDPIFDVDVPTKFYEYLACYKPLIGISEGEVAQIIKSTNIGRTVKAGDIDNFVKIIKELKSSPQKMQTIKNNCYVTLQRYSLDSIASSFLDLLKIQKTKRNTKVDHDY